MDPTVKISIVGVHPVALTDAHFHAASLSFVHGTSQTHIRDYFSRLTLVEFLIENCSERVDPFEFMQATTSPMRRSFYDYTYLTADGIESLGSESHPLGSFRLAMYLQDFALGEPLLTPWGELPCPPTTEMPPRLQDLAPFIVCD